jgi:radical SAM/Cys-rich protein
VSREDDNSEDAAPLGPGAALGFDEALARAGLPALRRSPVVTLQVNLGKKCNNACLHCHVEAGPARTEAMSLGTVGRLIDLIAASPAVTTVDLTGGAPELNPGFRRLVSAARALGREVIDRCNLTVLLEPGQEGLAEFLATQRVHVVASLPCYTEENVDRQRGKGVYRQSLEALRRLNALGYGRPGSGLVLDLVYNPFGPSLPGAQAALEQDYRRELRARAGIEFNHLLTMTNVPIARFGSTLERTGKAHAYQALLERSFNSATVASLMCRSLVSVGWDGRLHDCDFNQMLGFGLGGASAPRTVFDLESFEGLAARPVATARHCFACTAGAGSSCSGALG